MGQALRQSRKPERCRMEPAVLKLLVLACALAVSGCASMGLSDTLLSNTKSSFEEPSTIRSQNSSAPDDQIAATAVAADYSALQGSARSTNSDNAGGNREIAVVPLYAGGHSFVPRGARLGRPIPLPDDVHTPPAIRIEQPIEGNAVSQKTIPPSAVRGEANETTTGGQSPWQQRNSADAIETVTSKPSESSFGSGGWTAIPDPSAADPSAKNTTPGGPNEAFASDGGWNRDPGQSSQQQDRVAKVLVTHQPGDESGSTSSLEEPQSAVEAQSPPDEPSTEIATAGDTSTDNGTATAKEPTVLDKLRGLYTPRRDESISKRNRKSTPRWTNPFGLLRDPEAETADATLGATTPLLEAAEPSISSTETVDTTEAAQGSEALLAPVIAQVEKELAQWPTLPNGIPQNEMEWRRQQTDLRMLYLIAGRSAESIRVIELLPEKEQEFWQSMMLAMESYRRSDDSAARAEQLTETLDYVRTASRQLQPLSTMKIRRLNFCNRIDGFGSFSVFPTPDFNAGQPLLLYAEIENYRSELTSDGQYRSEFAAMIEFFREGETEPIASRTIRLPEIEDLCSAERTDYFQSYELTVPSLSPGKYRLRLRVRDQLSLQTATTELPFDIRPLGSQQ
ncbi:MAG: hypothetical protein WKF77_14300 [Planctomycetaceae bacterium]